MANTLFLSFAAITNSSDIVSAKWTVAGLGVFEAYVNGVHVGGEEYDARIKNPVFGGGAYQERVALRGRKADMGFRRAGRGDGDRDDSRRKELGQLFCRKLPY